MVTTFEHFYRQLGRATLGVLYAILAVFALALLSALLGFIHAVINFNSALVALGYAFGGMLVVFLLTSLVGVVVRYVNRRSAPAA